MLVISKWAGVEDICLTHMIKKICVITHSENISLWQFHKHLIISINKRNTEPYVQYYQPQRTSIYLVGL